MLQLKNIVKDYYVDKRPLHVLKDVSLSFPKQQFASILGPSGCGKTTMLNIIGGLDHYTDGDLVIDGKSTKDFNDEDWDAYRNRRIGFVFQSYNLISHLNVVENVEMAMQLAGVSASERHERALQALKEVGLEGESHKRVNQLSGGQMQRVAIARSLVNNPDIILADEPTGALDTKTSRLVMDILREISKSRLVIMVTHNEKIAKEYSNRIIRMLDGVITDDSKPEIENEISKGKEKNKRTSMSFYSALKSSWKNIRTKKGRTIMTSVAASFGIIGVALVLSVSNGFQNYVNRVESGTLSVYPLGIYTNAMMINTSFDRSTPNPFPVDEEVIVKDDTDQASPAITIKRNIITTDLINYIDSDILTPGYASSVIKNYQVDFHLTTEDPDGDVIAAGNTSLSDLSAVPAGSFHELLGDENFVREYYEPIGSESKYPSAKNEVALIIDKYNQINKSTLVKLGIISEDQNLEKIDFNDLIGKKYKIFTNDEYYTKKDSVSASDVYTGENKEITQYAVPTSTQLAGLYNDDSQGLDLSVVGILRIREDAPYSNLMDNGIGYTSALSDYVFAENSSSQIAQDLAYNYTIDKTQAEFQAIVSSIPEGINAQTFLTPLVDQFFTFYSPIAESDGIPTKIKFTNYLSEGTKLGATFTNHYFLNWFEEFLPTGLTDLTYLDMTYSPYYSVAVFPKDSKGKDAIKDAIDRYNAIKDQEWLDASQIGDSPYHVYYTDLISSVTATIGTLINVVSIVLIIFSSISLVVSSVMIGILTYTSVIERTKEIGVLRALGARKKDVGRLFEAETFIIGIFAGLIGIGITYLFSFPINAILNSLYADAGLGAIASLNPLHALILVGLNILLTMACGIIPSRAAARKDPVVALRTE
ncbi:MAG TPA: ABC transporter ATP-binding protein/permease [Bacilli bacterium]|nr:ABC transporter ATP-binding protein/permease [Bacilli bacterium]